MDSLTRLAARYLNPQRRRYAWLAGIMLWTGWLLSIGLGSDKLDLVGQVVGTDYLEFYAAGTTVRIGESARLYDVAYQTQLQQAIIGPQLRYYYGFITPPFLAWLFAPLSALPYLWSFALWSVLGLAALWASLHLLGTTDPRRAALWALTFFPVFAAISYGQNSLLSLLLLSLVYRLWRRGHGWAAGLTASLLLYKPQLLIGVALLWLLEGVKSTLEGCVMLSGWTNHNPSRRDPSEASRVAGDSSLDSRRDALHGTNPLRVTAWAIFRTVSHAGRGATADENLTPLPPSPAKRGGDRCSPSLAGRGSGGRSAIFRTGLIALLGLAVGGGLLSAFCLWQMPEASRAYVTFARTVLPNLPAYQEFPLWNLHTVWGFWRLLLPGAAAWADRLYWVCVAAGIGGFGYVWRRLRGRRPLQFAAAICLTLWITPHAMIYDWTPLLIPAALLWQELLKCREDWRVIFAAIWIAAFVSGPLTQLQLKWLPAAIQISVPTLLAVMVGVWRWAVAAHGHNLPS